MMGGGTGREMDETPTFHSPVSPSPRFPLEVSKYPVENWGETRDPPRRALPPVCFDCAGVRPIVLECSSRAQALVSSCGARHTRPPAAGPRPHRGALGGDGTPLLRPHLRPTRTEWRRVWSTPSPPKPMRGNPPGSPSAYCKRGGQRVTEHQKW